METYDHIKQKEKLLSSDDGIRIFLKVRDAAKNAIRHTGAFRPREIVKGISADHVWQKTASIGLLVELGEIKMITERSKFSPESLTEVYVGLG